MLSFGKTEQRIPAVGAKICCLYVCFLSVCHTLRPVHCSFKGDILEQVLRHSLWVDFDDVCIDS